MLPVIEFMSLFEMTLRNFLRKNEEFVTSDNTAIFFESIGNIDLLIKSERLPD